MFQLGGEMAPETFVIQTLRELPAGHHLYDFISGRKKSYYYEKKIQ